MTAGEKLAPASALWIGSDHPFDLHEAYVCFRRTFELARQPTAAELWITADSRYRLWVNGTFVARGPARGYPHAQPVDRLDVAALLRPGPNLIAAQVYQPGYSHFAYVHHAAAGLLAWLYCDGDMQLATDAHWRTRRDPSFAADVPRVSIYGSGVEERDLALEDGWPRPDYTDDAWASARVVAPACGPLWAGLQPRALPPLAERAAPSRLLAARRGLYPSVHDRDPHLALRAGWAQAAPQILAPDDAGWFSAALADDIAAYWLFDLGRGYAGQGWVEIAGAGGRERLAISYVDKLAGADAEPVISDPRTYCRVRLTDRFRLRAGDQVAETFGLRGGRYLLFQLVGPANAGLRLRFHARVSEYPLGATRELHMRDQQLARIIALCENTFRACLADGFVDCTWRESSQWLGDALPQALIMASMTDDTRPLRRAIELAAQGAYPDGVLPSVLPGEVHAYTVVDYNFMWVELLQLYYTLTCDRLFVRSMWPTLTAMLDRFHQDVNSDGLLISQPGRRLFLDWAPLSRAEPSAVYNLHYLLALQTAIALAEECDSHSGGDSRLAIDQSAERWRERATALRAAARAAFWQGGVWHDDRERTTFSQLAAALAILAGATEAGETGALLGAIAARSLDLCDEPAAGRMVLASPFMHHYVLEALRGGGKRDAAIEIIRRRWGRWADAGYPTTWENWNVDFPDGSQCHAFSAHPRYHLAEIARTHGGL
jgi:alpha-L-rhamnosidase